MQELEDTHYIQHVTEFGQHRQVVASEDIYLKNGNKLVARGRSITPDIYGSILKHKLAKPIDQSLSMDNAIANVTLAEIADRHTEENPLLDRMNQDQPSLKTTIRNSMSALTLPPQLYFKLTVLKEQLPAIFSHSMDVTITAAYLGLKLGMQPRETQNLLVSGLFHDIGMLHLDKNIFNKERPISEEERKSIYAHPIIGYMILKSFPEMETCAQAILQHHERLDGSGYPKGLSGEQIKAPGRILAIAELVASLTEQPMPLPYEHRLGAILKFNQDQYDPAGTRVLLDLFHQHFTEPAIPPVSLSREDFMNFIDSVWAVLDDWDRVKQSGANLPSDIRDYIGAQTSGIKTGLVRSGLTRADIEIADAHLDSILERPCEIMAILNEAMYQLKNTIRELERRWPDISLDRNLTTAINDWIASTYKIMGMSDDQDEVPDFTGDDVP